MKPSVTFQITKALAERPQLFALGMAVIAEHSEAESYLSLIMMALLGTNPAPGAAIFSVIRANHLQTKALHEVASEVLDDQDVEKLKDALKTFDLSAGYRNRIAHRMWGIDERISDGIVFAKTNAAAVFSVDILHIPKLKTAQEKADFAIHATEKMNANLEIWREEDFVKAINTAEKAKGDLQSYYMEISGKAMLRGIEATSVFHIEE